MYNLWEKQRLKQQRVSAIRRTKWEDNASSLFFVQIWWNMANMDRAARLRRHLGENLSTWRSLDRTGPRPTEIDRFMLCYSGHHSVLRHVAKRRKTKSRARLSIVQQANYHQPGWWCSVCGLAAKPLEIAVLGKRIKSLDAANVHDKVVDLTIWRILPLKYNLGQNELENLSFSKVLFKWNYVWR